jgi:hypothetical protein
MKKLLSWVLIFLVSITILFGAYQLFVDEVEAGMFDCGSNSGCSYGGQSCGGDLGCECTGSAPFFYCWPPDAPEQ